MIMLLAVLLTVSLVGCSKSSRPYAALADLPDSIRSQVAEASSTAGAYVFSDQGDIYLLVSSGAEQQAERHLRLLPKTTSNKVTEDNVLTVYFEQYTPAVDEVSAENWFRILAFRQTQPNQIKVMIDGALQYTLDLPRQ
jgi:hypothetical protein